MVSTRQHWRHIPPKEMTPEEMMNSAFEIMQEKLNDELLVTVRKSTPRFFEKLVVDLVVSMGYGGSIKEAGKAIGMSGDEGIDGIIKEDLLGLDVIYIQAKNGKVLLEDLKSKSLRGLCRVREQEKEFLLRQVLFRKTLLTMFQKLIQKLFL